MQSTRSSEEPLHVGVILAGGRARRMGGGDKGLLELAGAPILAHVIARLAPQVSRLALNANGAPERFSGFGLPVLSDPIPGQPGPLAGILAGLDWAASLGARAIVTAAADSPFFPHDLAARLIAGAGPGSFALAATREGLQPTFGLWPVALRDDLRAAIEGGARRVGEWALLQGAARVPFPEGKPDPFFNINTPEDLARAEEIMAGMKA
ncbi:MAG: molybdenum cofactor guanylyltransferase MobA [Alphaproteobacteria bacterium]|nr:MAG: molybdenum cofactor guanylyltransferase MobA [Alphaproteobacteria bacterium]